MEGKELIKKRFAHNLDGYDALSVVQRSICEHIDELLEDFIPSIHDNGIAVELGAGTGFFTRHLLKRFSNTSWLINDIVPQTETYIEKVVAQSGYVGALTYRWGDAENIDFPSGISLLASASLFQWFYSLDEFLNRVGTNIAKGGYVVFSSFGEDNFFEIREASLCKKGIVFPSYQDVIQKMMFHSVSDMLHYLKDTGVNGSSNGSWNRREYNDFCSRYNEMYSKEEGITLSFNPIIFILKKI
ncbi:MAG: methyltransferase domain-containing protein [Rikenellaceae bacterium]